MNLNELQSKSAKEVKKTLPGVAGQLLDGRRRQLFEKPVLRLGEDLRTRLSEHPLHDDLLEKYKNIQGTHIPK